MPKFQSRLTGMTFLGNDNFWPLCQNN